MRIVVAYKWTRDPHDAVVSADGRPDYSRAKYAISDYDPVAIEVGRTLADNSGGELIGVSIGGAETASSMARKAALSRGLDRLVVLADNDLEDAGTLQTARALTAVIREVGEVDLVITGDSSVDVGAQMVPAVLGGLLEWPTVLGVTAASEIDGRVQVERESPLGSELLSLSTPAVLAVAPDAATPRVPGMKDILGAGKKPTDTLDLDVPACELTVMATASAPGVQRRGITIDGADPDQAASELLTALRDQQVL